MVSLSTPRLRSSWLNARRPRPRPLWRLVTQAAAKASSSISPTSVKRSSTAVAASGGTPRRAMACARSARVRGWDSSSRSAICRATFSGDSSDADSAIALPASDGSLEVDRDRIRHQINRCVGVGALSRGRQINAGTDAELLLDLLLDLVGEVGVVAQERPRILLALAELVGLVGVPSTGLAHDALLDTEVDQAALAADALAPHDVELGLLERRRNLVLHHLHASARTDRVLPVLERLDAADVQPHGRVELQRLATSRRFRAVVHDDTVSQVVVRSLDLDVETVHRARLRLDVDVDHARWHRVHRGLDELRLDRTLTLEPWQQFVRHRGMHVRRDDLLEPRRGLGRQLQHLLLLRPTGGQLDLESVRVTQVFDQALASARRHRVDADLDATATARRARLHTLRTHREAAIVHVPDGKRQWRQCLEVLLGQVLLAIAEVDRFTQLRELG